MIDRAALGRTIVTGAGGFIGGRLRHLLAVSGADVRGWCRRDVDLLDGDAVAGALARESARTIFHVAAAGVGAGQAHNIDIVHHDLRMIDNLMRHAAVGTRIVLAGSMSEYGRAGRLAEDDRCAPRNAYGIAKLATALHAIAYAGERGVDVRIARLFGVYGPGEASTRFFPTLLASLRDGVKVALSDGLQLRDFVHVDDACAAMVALASVEGGPDVVNVGTGSAVRVRDAAEWIADAAGTSRVLLGFGDRLRSPHDEDLLVADVGRLEATVGFVPPQRLAPGLSLSLFDLAHAQGSWSVDRRDAPFPIRA